VPRAAGADDGIIRTHIWRRTDLTEAGSLCHICQDAGTVEVRVVDHVEKSTTNLQVEPFTDSPGFTEREVPIFELRSTKRVAAQIAECACRRRRQYRATLDLTAKICKQKRLGRYSCAALISGNEPSARIIEHEI
jgi:hypothetical protein